MKLLILSIFLSFSFNSHALDFNKIKEKARDYTIEILGPKVASKFFKMPEEKSKLSLPLIPKSVNDATATEVYSKVGHIYSQGDAFQKLTPDEKKRYDLRFIEELFLVVRNKEGRDDEISSFLNVLSQGGTREGVYRKLILDEIYINLESFKDAPSVALADFVLAYSKKYLNVSYKKESVLNLNLYSLKRILGEKTLDVLDLLAANENNIYSWYTILSSEWAKEYQGVFQNKLRLETDEDRQLNWVKSVPFQHIKLEVIIKLNIIMNYLQNT